MFTWTVEDENGTALKTSETFESKEAAEAWMGSEWSALAGAGGHVVVLMEGDAVVYRMSLEAE